MILYNPCRHHDIHPCVSNKRKTNSNLILYTSRLTNCLFSLFSNKHWYACRNSFVRLWINKLIKSQISSLFYYLLKMFTIFSLSYSLQYLHRTRRTRKRRRRRKIQRKKNSSKIKHHIFLNKRGNLYKQ